MKFRRLGHTELEVSLICLGTMTWGEQNSEEEAHRQCDIAQDYGVNFVDLAEMYPVPPKAQTQGRTEIYFGNWLKTQQRERLIVATKVTGRSHGFDYLGRGETRLNKQQIQEALDGSLKRLQTDYVDLYQLHWPERATNFFGKLGYEHHPESDGIPLLETLEALAEQVKAGKIRYIGLSNETPWGIMECQRLAEKHNLPFMVSVQNPYNLLNRTFEIGAAECAIRAQCGLLAYSPLAFGVLSGKYLGGNKPEGARLTLFDRFTRYTTTKAETATARYAGLAQEHGLSLAQMALAFVNHQPFVTSNIIGATKETQLKENIEAVEITLSEEVLRAIHTIHMDAPNPCP